MCILAANSQKLAFKKGQSFTTDPQLVRQTLKNFDYPKKNQKRIENLESKQAATVREKQELLKKQKTLNIIRQNFTALLSEQSSQIYPSQRDNVQL